MACGVSGFRRKPSGWACGMPCSSSASCHRGEFPIGPGELGALLPGVGQALFTVRSFTFEVTVDAEIAGVKRQYKALLRRENPRNIQVLYLHGA